MNTTKLKLSLVPLILAAVTGVHAADALPEAERPLSRAEVLADLEVWQRCGMAAFHTGEAEADTFSDAYRAAHQAYVAARNSPEFAQIVARIARERGEQVEVATRG